MSTAAIIGAGPAGLMAAYACERNGIDVEIFSSDAQPSQISYDMFLQRPLPGIPQRTTSRWRTSALLSGHDPSEPDARITYVKRGNPRIYAYKCYGDLDAPVSWESIKWGSGVLWWLRDVYEALWERYAGLVQPRLVDSAEATDLVGEFHLVLSTVPAPSLCTNLNHSFGAVPTWLVRDGRPYEARLGNELVYNGDGGSGWFRRSDLRGVSTLEYARDPQVHYPHEITEDPVILMGKKFTGNTCDCHPKIHRIGRWAQWQRGVLNHHAFEQATAILASAGLGKGA